MNHCTLPPPIATAREELFNALTHGIGVLASVAGGAVLLTLAILSGDLWRIISAAIYSVSLLLLYAASTLYHAIPHRTAKSRLRVLDHCAIFVLIAGTYTPFTLVTLRGAWGWAMFGVVWALAVAGIVFKLFCIGRFPRLSTALYVGMGWLVVFAIRPLAQALPLATLGWLAAGGLAYMIGVAFFHSRRIPYAHSIWHGFVILGSVCHFVAIASEVVPRGV